MAYQIAGGSEVGFQPISEISTTAKHKPGTEVPIVDYTNGYRGIAVYVSFKASTAVSAGTIVQQETLITTTGVPFRVATATVALVGTLGTPLFVTLTAVTSVASVQYGWVLVVGVAPTLKTAVKPLLGSNLGLDTSSGRVLITTTVTNQIIGIRLVQASVTTTTSTVDIYWNRAHGPQDIGTA